MKLKLLAAMALMLGVAVLPAVKAGAVAATSLAPNFTEQTVTASDGCSVKVKHTNFGGAVSQMARTGIPMCREDAYVETIGMNSTTGAYTTQRCYIGVGLGDTGNGNCTRFNSGGYAITQPQIPGSALLGTKLCLRGDLINCEDYEFAIAGATIANPTHGTVINVRETNDGTPNDECNVSFAHGSFLTTAVSRISSPNGICNWNKTYVEMSVVDTTDATVDTQRCYLNTGSLGNCSFYSNGEQANIANSYLISSTVHVCGSVPVICDTEGGTHFFPGL